MHPPDPAPLDDRIVEELSTRGHAVAPGFLASALVGELAAEERAAWDAGGLRRAGIGGAAAVRPGRRGDSILWLDPAAASAVQRAYLSRMETLRLTVNRALLLGLFDLEAHFAVYPPGALYERHLDRLRGESRRIVSTVLYLNQDWTADDGGALRLWLGESEEQGFVDVEPVGGTLVAFLSDRFYHAVLPSRRERLSIAGWFRTRP